MDIPNLIEQLRMTVQLARSRPIELRLYGGEEASAAYATFTKPHRRLPFLRNKTFGVALLPVSVPAADPFAEPRFRASRRRRKRALDRGYRFAPINGSDHVDRILAINRSSPHRQGLPLSPSYTDAVVVARYCQQRSPFFGIFDAERTLRAYCHASSLGDVALLARFFGEHDRLEDGIMYLLLSELVSHFAMEQPRDGHPLWIMYDTYIGASAGMRTFKERCGFQPYRVRWLWAPDGASA
ncbi:MAG TPA: hypothetical protein VHW69_04025 [Rhizomicrobium sp.]|jgi:hypothetical protein|nr:hypothetical protein [Rhizomicrobium sp.]